MIAKLSGILDSVAQGSLILDVNGVGYQVFASQRTLSQIGQIGDAISLRIDTQVREDHIHLFGFIDAAEQDWFRLLTTVQGVGAKAGLAILSACPPDKLMFAIASGDAAALRVADGVGPKLATRIVTELKDKAGNIDLGSNMSVSKPSKGSGKVSSDKILGNAAANNDNDAVAALVALSFPRADAFAAVMTVKNRSEEELPLPELIRLSLAEITA
jgi:Holliday junction DNA helicase RuvA